MNVREKVEASMAEDAVRFLYRCKMQTTRGIAVQNENSECTLTLVADVSDTIPTPPIAKYIATMETGT